MPYSRVAVQRNIAAWIRNASREAKAYSKAGNGRKRNESVDLGVIAQRENYVFPSDKKVQGLNRVCQENYALVTELLTTYKDLPVAKHLEKLKRGYDAWIMHNK
jgi:hypothetical protein